MTYEMTCDECGNAFEVADNGRGECPTCGARWNVAPDLSVERLPFEPDAPATMRVPPDWLRLAHDTALFVVAWVEQEYQEWANADRASDPA